MTVRVGFIGAGGIAIQHLSNLMLDPHAEIVALCDLSTEQVENAKERTTNRARKLIEGTGSGRSGIEPLTAASYIDYRSMLEKESLDAVYVCLPPFAHGEIESRVIEAGIPMMVEKPVALNLGTAANILAKIREKNLVAASGYQLRYIKALQTAKERLAGRTIGMVIVTRFGATPGVPWYHCQDKSGGQPVEMATHEMDMTRFLVGDVTSVYAQADTCINNKENPDYDIFDVNCMTLRFENGAVGNFANNFISGYGKPQGAHGVHVIADNVTVSYTAGKPVQIITAEGTEEIPIGGNPMAEEDRAFIHAVANNDPSLLVSDYENGVRTLAVTLAADRSARTGQPIRIDEFLAKEAPGL